jgi:hypothetical protein
MKTHQSSCCAFAAAVVLYFVILAVPANSQTVLNSSRVGGYAEDITFVSSGALKDKIVIVDGLDVFAVENKKRPTGTMTKIFDVKVPEIDVFPNGIAYVASEDLFVLNQNVHTNKLYFFDQTGAYKGRRDIQYLNPGYLPGHLEGLAYIPASSPFFPDHLVMVVLDDLAGGPQRLEIMRRDGVVEAELYRPDWPASFIADAGIAGVSFFAPNRLLVTTYDNKIWTLDFTGNIVSGPVTLAGSFGFEGVVQLGDSSIAVVDFPQKLLFLDSSLNRLPGQDRNDLIGLNLNLLSGIAWNSDTNQLLIKHDDSAPISATGAITAVPTALDSATQVVSLSPDIGRRRLAYLSDDHLIATLQFNPANDRAILLYNNDGTFNSQVSLSPASLGFNPGAPIAFTYIPTTHEFVVNFNGLNGDPNQPLERRSLRVLSRAGTLVRNIDLTGTGTAGVGGLDFFNSGGGDRFIILGSAGRVFVTNLNGDSRNSNGVLFGEFNSRVKLGLLNRNDITAITTGPLAGAFAVIDGQDGEVVIFRLD